MCSTVMACGDTTSVKIDSCNVVPLPLTGNTNGPRIADVALDVQTSGIVVLATATDPQGDADLHDVLQKIGVFPDPECRGAPLIVTDDILDGLEESFDFVVTPTSNKALYDAIAAANRWPVQVDFEDRPGNRVSGRVMARIQR